MSGQEPTEVIWRPQAGPQKALIDCPVPEVFYGGARGGGKTDGVLGKYALKAQRYGDGFNALFFRRELPMLDDAIERSHEIFSPLNADWNEQKKTWRFPWGGRLRFRPLERAADADKYQGQNVSDACVEEAGQYPDSRPIDRLNGVLRSAKGTPTQLILTGNPGGAGQVWIKMRYIDPAPQGMTILQRKLPSGRTHRYVFIPSRLQNNRILMTRDPEYINRLYLVGSDALVRAWLDGDWDVVEGAFFDCWFSWRERGGVCRPFSIPKHWRRFRSGDWGSARPFSFGWWAVASENFEHPDGFTIPRNAIVRYREWYGASGPNTGLKLYAEEVGAKLAEMERGDEIAYGVLDPSAFAESGGPSIAERIIKGSGMKVMFRGADNTRIAQKGAMGGWDQMRARFIGEDDRPMIYCFSTCVGSIRTIPTLQHDQDRPEDLDSDGEDHAADDWRYACMSRPYAAPIPRNIPDRSHLPNEAMTFDEMIKLNERKTKERI